jgi:hypothetical protein
VHSANYLQPLLADLGLILNTLQRVNQRASTIVQARFKRQLWRQLANVDVRSDPIAGRCGVTLTAHVLRKEYIARGERYSGSVTETDINCAREGNHPTTPRGWMPVNNMRREIISEEKSLGGTCGVEKV